MLLTHSRVLAEQDRRQSSGLARGSSDGGVRALVLAGKLGSAQTTCSLSASLHACALQRCGLCRGRAGRATYEPATDVSLQSVLQMGVHHDAAGYESARLVA